MSPVRIGQSLFAASLLTIGLSQALLSGRQYVPEGAIDLTRRLPDRMGAWIEVPTAQDVVDPADSGAQEDAKEVYDRIENRTYRRPDGAQVLLTLAYRRVQEQESKIHRPEICYFAQGFVISRPTPTTVATDGVTLPAVTFQARSAHRSETVVYWIRVGDIISTSAWQTRLYLAKLGLRQRVPDGLLVRASIEDPPGADAVTRAADVGTIAQFLGALVKSSSQTNRPFLAGAA